MNWNGRQYDIRKVYKVFQIDWGCLNMTFVSTVDKHVVCPKNLFVQKNVGKYLLKIEY